MEPATVDSVELDTSAGFALPQARWLQVTFEVNREAALSLMPPDVGRPIPPYGRLLVAGSAEGNLALLSVGGRYRMMPRNVLVAAIADGTSEAARGAFGSGTVDGHVAIERTGDEIVAEVAGPEGKLATVRIRDAYAIEPTMLRWDAFVVFGRHDGANSIAEATPAHEPATAFLSKATTIEMDVSLPRAHAWRQLQPLNIVSACYVEGRFALGAPVVAQSWP